MAIVRLGIVAADRFHLRIALAGLVAMNRALMRAYGAPPLYQSGVRYQPEKPDEWETYDILLRRGYGDCEDLSSWRAAELQESGVDAIADVYPTRRPNKWHAIVVYPDGRTEDPSLRLGMARFARRS